MPCQLIVSLSLRWFWMNTEGCMGDFQEEKTLYIVIISLQEINSACLLRNYEKVRI